MCGVDKTDCLLKFKQDDLNLNDCACEDKCNLTTYAVTATQSYWPQIKSLPQNCAHESEWRWSEAATNCAECADCNDDTREWRWELGPDEYSAWSDTDPPDGNKCDYTSQCLDDREWNYMVIQVYYETMGYTKIIESPAMQWIDLVSSLGGLFGLWIGCSMMTLLEFVGFALVLICYCAAHCTILRGVAVTPEEKHRKDLDDIDEHLAKHAPDIETPRTEKSASIKSGKKNKGKKKKHSAEATSEHNVDPYSIVQDENSEGQPPIPV